MGTRFYSAKTADINKPFWNIVSKCKHFSGVISDTGQLMDDFIVLATYDTMSEAQESFSADRELFEKKLRINKLYKFISHDLVYSTVGIPERS